MAAMFSTRACVYVVSLFRFCQRRKVTSRPAILRVSALLSRFVCSSWAISELVLRSEVRFLEQEM